MTPPLHPSVKSLFTVELPPSSSYPTLDTRSLFAHGRELVIRHRGEDYRLRLTRNDKLILNK